MNNTVWILERRWGKGDWKIQKFYKSEEEAMKALERHAGFYRSEYRVARFDRAGN